MNDARDFTLSFYLKTLRTPAAKWYHRLLGVQPLAVATWERVVITTPFPSEVEAVRFLKRLTRPECLGPLVHPLADPHGGQVESVPAATRYIRTTA